LRRRGNKNENVLIAMERGLLNILTLMVVGKVIASVVGGAERKASY